MTPEQQYEQLMALLLEWNAKINLTAITRPADIRVKHIEDSLALLPFLHHAQTLVDLGSGAGFPGIPLKIARPDMRVVLVEATRKKVGFLHAAITALGLTGIVAICGRAESPEIIKQTGTCDIVVSRATWLLADFFPLALPYCARAGKIIAMKGPKWKEELSAAEKILTRSHLDVTTHHYTLSNNDRRVLVIAQRESA